MDLFANERQIVSKKRVADHGEVYTRQKEVNAILNLVIQETERIDSRFLEPACGTGNFLSEVLSRKLQIVEDRYYKSQNDFEQYALIAVSSIYGIDILEDNVTICRSNLFDIFEDKFKNIFKKLYSFEYLGSIKFILEKNIVWGDALTLKQAPNNTEPIVFSEWGHLGNGIIKRRDFTFKELTRSSSLDGPNLFSDLGENAFIPKPLKEYPVTHYLRISYV